MRDVVKTGTYGGMHLVVAVGVAYAVSGNWAIALGIGLLEPVVQTVFYNLHERVWAWRDRRANGQARTAAPTVAVSA